MDWQPLTRANAGLKSFSDLTDSFPKLRYSVKFYPIDMPDQSAALNVPGVLELILIDAFGLLPVNLDGSGFFYC